MKDTLDRRLERDLPRLLIRTMPPARPRFLELRPEGGRHPLRIGALRSRFGTVATMAAGLALIGTGGVGAKAALTGSLNPFVWSQTPAPSPAPPPLNTSSKLGSTAGGAGQGSTSPGGPTGPQGAGQITNPSTSATPSVNSSQSPPPHPTHPPAPTPSPSPTSKPGHNSNGQNPPHGTGRPTP